MEAVVCQPQRCLNANLGEADGNMSRWEYRKKESAADGKTGPYLTEGRRSDHDELRLTGPLWTRSTGGLVKLQPGSRTK